MAVGEKIQAYRKALGISQEELGQRLLVSRQTISLWEKGQTMPTIDNLIRLKEIFGVSVDEILDVGNGADAGKTQPEPEPMPNEAYTVSFTKEELREIGKEDSKPLYRNAIVFSAFFLYWIFTALWNSASDAIIGFVIGIFLLGAIAYGKRIYNQKSFGNNGRNALLIRFMNIKSMKIIYASTCTAARKKHGIPNSISRILNLCSTSGAFYAYAFRISCIIFEKVIYRKIRFSMPISTKIQIKCGNPPFPTNGKPSPICCLQ